MQTELRFVAVIAFAFGLVACGDTGAAERRQAEADAKLPDVAAGADADDTALNTRDRDQNTLTPMDQSNAPGDLEITRQIRQEIMEYKDLSIDAANVKVITKSGLVTLRGPVETEQEKLAIAEISRGIAGVTRVDDQIEIARD